MYSIDDIIHLSGIPKDKVMEVCNLLSLEGYLIFNKETGKYRLTKDKKLLEQIGKLWQQCKKSHDFEQMSSKIEDIIAFGKPLALSEKGPGDPVKDIGIPGLNIIFGNLGNITGETPTTVESKAIPGLPGGHCILVKGAPGTGKTTLGMQIALHLKRYRSRFLTFEEDVNQLINDLSGYIQSEDEKSDIAAWKKSDINEVTRSLVKVRTPGAWENPDEILEELISFFDKELPHLIVIDSISRFRDLGGDTKARQLLRQLIRNLKCRRITSIFLAEDRGDENAFEEYEVDGIINLQWAGELLTLTVKKLRGMKAYKGPHSAAFLTVADLQKPHHLLISRQKSTNEGQEAEGKNGEGKQDKTPKSNLFLTVGYNVFPDISVFKDISTQDKEMGKVGGDTQSSSGKEDKEKVKETGTPGLNELLPLRIDNKNEYGFKRGETILLVGSAGSGKTLLALNFMLDGFGTNNRSNNENTLWINLEGDLGTLKFAVKGFEGDHKIEIDKMVQFAQDTADGKINKRPRKRFDFIDFPPINVDLNKIVYTLEAMDRKYGIDRLVIDSITELERAKGGGQPAVKVFLAGLIQFLRERKITTMFVCRSDAFFRSIDRIQEQIASLVDLIICIRNFDIHNQIHKGIYIQKARGRRHDSKIRRMEISSRGIKIEDSGWDLENLLAGDTSYIETPRIFFKLFYENPAEEFLNKEIIEDFDKERYPGEIAIFSLVKKPSIYTEFWSFGGQFSPGHANTRVLSIADHVISAFRDNERLAKLKNYIKSELLQNINDEKHIRKFYRLRDEKKQRQDEDDHANLNELIIDAVPCYRDYGVIAFNPGIAKNNQNKKLQNFVNFLSKKVQNIKPDNGSEWEKNRYTWESLLEMIKKINEDKPDNFPFAFPPLDNRAEFVAFFMELLWSFGGDIYEIELGKYYTRDKYRKKSKIPLFFSILWKLNEKLNPEFSDQEPKFETLISSLKENSTGNGNNKIHENFEKNLKIYGLDKRNINSPDFKKWIAKNLTNLKENIKKYSNEKEVLKLTNVMKLDDKPFEETIKLMLRLVHYAKVTNPIEGDYRDKAILSRNWYSRLFLLKKGKCDKCSAPDKKKCDYYSDKKKEICMDNYLFHQKPTILPLPLPLAKITFDDCNCEYYRSITCMTYWSMVMLDNALSPEIGGNFIESMNAPEYYEKRLKKRLGMPVMDLELSQEKYLENDEQSYALLKRIMENGHKNEKIKKEITDKHECGYSEKKEIFSEENAFIRREFIEAFNEKERNQYYKEVSKDKMNQRVFYPKLRHSRTAFYQLEQALHYQLKQLFIANPEYRDNRIYKDFDIYEETKKICKEEITTRQSGSMIEIDEKKWEKCLKKIKHEFQVHAIFELLSYFYHNNDNLPEDILNTDSERKKDQ